MAEIATELAVAEMAVVAVTVAVALVAVKAVPAVEALAKMEIGAELCRLQLHLYFVLDLAAVLLAVVEPARASAVAVPFSAIVVCVYWLACCYGHHRS